ncbi:glucoamylase family protein [Echinicola jeungdonensis]|uniref:Glucoamylase family protein n=1 Tax=Echinicola jeungdonensis TaxID=709343 RepID=A0ABV5J8U6_9BACT|nr:glucoamylase family protein [Echinicola jeungdonensis]MDN3670241.1 glucoamylase family protein [Echinicola jeungdonensis]
MRYSLLLLVCLALFFRCNDDENGDPSFGLLEVSAGDLTINLNAPITENIPVDRSITLTFSSPVSPSHVAGAITLHEGNTPVNITTNLLSGNRSVVINSQGVLKRGTQYRIEISNSLKSANGVNFPRKEVFFKTILEEIQVGSFTIENSNSTPTGTIVDVPVSFSIKVQFSIPIDQESLQNAISLNGPNAPNLQYSFSNDGREVTITGNTALQFLSQYTLEIDESLKGINGETFEGFTESFYAEIDESPKFPMISEEELMTKVQAQTFRYFWDFAHENSGLARERNTSGNLVTIGGSGFGVMALIVGVERGFITRNQAVERWTKIVNFLAQADRFHGVWPHWMNGNTGETIPFSQRDNGGDLVETAFMIQGLLSVKAYLNQNIPEEKAIIDTITQLWHEVEWDWYTQGGQDVLYWHWSPEYQWEINLPIRGYNESLIVYVLAASSPTYPIEKAVYDQGWARQGGIINGQTYYQYNLPLGNEYGGPLFFAHYSFLGLDPRNLSDQYANYWEQNVNHSLINQAYCARNPKGFVGYSENSWGLTASDNHLGYSAHSPTNDLGVITPTAALSSFPYTPEGSMKALNHYYYLLGDRLWGDYGFYDAFNITEGWYADSYLAIDQGPIIIMIENHRTGLLWDLFMEDQDIRSGLGRLDFSY